MNTRQLLSVGIDIGTTTTQVIFSRLELVNRAAVSQVPRYEFIKRDISWQSPVFFTPVDKQGELKEAELEALILAQYRAAGIAPQAVDSGAIIITGESAKTRNARPAVMALSQSLGDFVASAGPHLESVIAGHGAGAQTLSRQRMCRVLNIDIGGGTSNYALFDAGNLSATACLNVGGRLLETDAQGRVVHAHSPGQRIVDAVFGPGTDALSLTAGQLAQVARRMAGLIVEVIDGRLSPLAQGLMHPSREVNKTYRVGVPGIVPQEKLDLLRLGVKLDDGMTAPAVVTLLEYDHERNMTYFDITIHEGRNRQIRRMCDYIGFPVRNLKRIKFGTLSLKGLSKGKMRELNEDEAETLKKAAKLNG